MKTERKMKPRHYAMIFMTLFALIIIIAGVSALTNDDWETLAHGEDGVHGEGGVHGPGRVHGEGGVHGPGGVHGEGGVHG
jgi:hypothetical protein